MSIAEVQHFEYTANIQYPPLIACNSSGLFLFSTANGTLHLFDAKSGTNFEITEPRMTESRITCMGIPPSHAFIAVCYENGTILFYSLFDHKIIKSLTKFLDAKVTHCTFVSDFEFVIFDSTLTLSLCKIVSLSIFGYNVNLIKLGTFQNFANQLSSPAVYRAVDDHPKDIDTQSYCCAPKFGHLIGLSLCQKFILAEISPHFKILYETDNVDEGLEKPSFSFSLHDPDLLYVAYSSNGGINVLEVSQARKDNNAHYFLKVIYNHPIPSPATFVSFFSTSVIGVVHENFDITLFDFIHKDQPSLTQKCETKGLYFDDNNKLVVFSPHKIDAYYLSSFKSTFDLLKEHDQIDEIIELAKRVAQDDPKSIVGMSTDPKMRLFELERVMNDVLSEYARSKMTSDAFTFSEEIVALMIELKNRQWVPNDGLTLFDERGYSKDFIEVVIEKDPDASKFNYNRAFVHKIFELGFEYNEVKAFLLCLPPKICKPKWLIKLSLEHNDIETATKVCIDKMCEPIIGLNLLEALNKFEDIPDAFINPCFKGRADMIEWILTEDSQTHQFSRFVKCVQVSPEKMSEALKWMNGVAGNIQLNLYNAFVSRSNSDEVRKTIKQIYAFFTSNSNKSTQGIEDEFVENDSINSIPKLTNEYYINAILTTFSDLSIDYKSKLFKEIEFHLMNFCPEKLNKKSMNYIINSIFTSEFAEPDNREKLLCILLFTGTSFSAKFGQLFIPLCKQYRFDEALEFLYNKLHLYDELLKLTIYNKEFEESLSFIRSHYHEDEASKKSIEMVVVEYAPYFIEYDINKFINVLADIKFDLLYTQLPDSIQDEPTRFFFLRSLCLSFTPKSDQVKTTKRSSTAQIKRNMKSNQEENIENVLAEIIKANEKGDLDRVYCLAEKYYGKKAKVLLPIILKNMTSERLIQMECIDEKKLDAKDLIEYKTMKTMIDTLEVERIQKEKERQQKEQEESIKQKQKEDQERIEQENELYYNNCLTNLEKRIETVIPFIAKYYPNEMILILRKFHESILKSSNVSSIVQIIRDHHIYDSCAYLTSFMEDKNESLQNIRILIIKNAVQYEKTILESITTIFSDDHYKSLENLHFIMTSFLVPFTNNEMDMGQFYQTCSVYREIWDIAESLSMVTIDDILGFTMTKMSRIEVERKRGSKFDTIIRSVTVGRVYNTNMTDRARELIGRAVQSTINESDNPMAQTAKAQIEMETSLNHLTCARCKLRLFVGGTAIAILKCGHAVHFTSFCCPLASRDGVHKPIAPQKEISIFNHNVECPRCIEAQKIKEEEQNPLENNHQPTEQQNETPNVNEINK